MICNADGYVIDMGRLHKAEELLREIADFQPTRESDGSSICALCYEEAHEKDCPIARARQLFGMPVRFAEEDET